MLATTLRRACVPRSGIEPAPADFQTAARTIYASGANSGVAFPAARFAIELSANARRPVRLSAFVRAAGFEPAQARSKLAGLPLANARSRVVQYGTVVSPSAVPGPGAAPGVLGSEPRQSAATAGIDREPPRNRTEFAGLRARCFAIKACDPLPPVGLEPTQPGVKARYPSSRAPAARGVWEQQDSNLRTGEARRRLQRRSFAARIHAPITWARSESAISLVNFLHPCTPKRKKAARFGAASV